jgi:hypothetical protein
MPTRSGPTTKDTTTIALGLAQIRVGLSATYIGQIAPILASTTSLGTLANTKFMSNQEFYKLESGYPLLEDAVFPLRENAAMELAFREITPFNMALAKGKDPTTYTTAHSGQVALGDMATPVFLRMESHYTYPDQTNKMIVIFPRAQVLANPEVDHQMEEPANVPIVIEAKRADSGTSGGHVIWDNMPLGRILWTSGSETTTSTTTTTTAP